MAKINDENIIIITFPLPLPLQIERDKQFMEDEVNRSRAEKSDIDRTIHVNEQNVNELRLQVNQLQQVLDEKEQSQSQK